MIVMTWARTRRRAGAGYTEPRSRASEPRASRSSRPPRAPHTLVLSSMLCCKRNELLMRGYQVTVQSAYNCLVLYVCGYS